MNDGTASSGNGCPAGTGDAGCSAAACYDEDTSSVCFPNVFSCDCRYPSAMPTPSPTTFPPTPSPTTFPPTQSPTASPTPIPTPPPTVTAKMTVAPNILLLSATKPGDTTNWLFLSNSNTWRLNGTATIRNASLPTTVNVSIVPSTFVIPPGDFVQLFVSLSSLGLQSRDYKIDVDIDATSPRSIGILPIRTSVPAQITIVAKADARTSEVTILGSPVIKEQWNGVQISAFDVDGFAIFSNQNEDFAVSLRFGDLAASCAVGWDATENFYLGGCTVPDASKAGKWLLNVTLDYMPVFSSFVNVWCQAERYEHDGTCRSCPDGASCVAGTTLATLELKRGYWRSGDRLKEKLLDYPDAPWQRKKD